MFKPRGITLLAICLCLHNRGCYRDRILSLKSIYLPAPQLLHGISQGETKANVMNVHLILAILMFVETIRHIKSTCYCPLTCTRYASFDGHLSCVRSGRTHCADTEAHEECRAALLETTDMINSIGSLASNFLLLTHEEGEIAAVQAAYLRTKLSEAFELEHEKPVPDCEVGLNTNTLASGSRGDLCFSAELFDQ